MMATLYIGNKNYSSWSLRPWLLMKMTGFEFKEDLLHLLSDSYRQRIPDISPSGKVPVLKHNQQVIWDSLAICEYIAELFPKKHCWPKNSQARAKARAIVSEMHSGFPSLRNAMPMDCRKLAEPVGVAQSPKLAAEITRIHDIWQDCRQDYASDGPFLFGQFSIVDAFFAPVVIRFLSYGVALNETLKAYCDVMLNLPHLKDWIAQGVVEKEWLDYSVITV